MLSLILGDVLESSCVVLLCKVGGKDNINEVWEKLMAFHSLTFINTSYKTNHKCSEQG